MSSFKPCKGCDIRLAVHVDGQFCYSCRRRLRIPTGKIDYEVRARKQRIITENRLAIERAGGFSWRGKYRQNKPGG